MAKNLVIVESPAKAKTINKILGHDFIVKASMGHVRDLPVKALNVDIKNEFKPKYAVSPGKKKVVAELKTAIAGCDTVYLAPDPDREGEAIAWHLQELLDKGGTERKFVRVQYNEITPTAVRKAFANPGVLDMNRVDAQQARRILDRIVGYMVSPMLWRRLRRGLSAGRVQSVALRLICEREDEIKKFVPVEFWVLGAKVRKFVDPLDPFVIKLMRINNEKADVKNSDQAAAIRSELEGRPLKVVNIATREVSKRAFPPYITSTLQQAASSYCGFSPSRTMGIAQKLYEGVDLGDGPVGLITYMRTDSVNVSQDALASCREFIKQKFGADHCPDTPNFYKSRSGAQEAHEAIRPTDVNRTPESLEAVLDPTEAKLYRLIWNRFVSSQMAPARISQRTVKIESQPAEGKPNSYLFSATASEVVFAGYMKVAGIEVKKEKESDAQEEDAVADKLPPLTEGEPVECLEWMGERKETQPPPRFSEASLIKALESNGVGRPSTYAQILSTLHQREYVKQEKKSLMPTELGMQVCSLLVLTLNQLFDVKFTALMEDSLDEIEKGTVKWTDMLGTFYKQFEEWMSQTKLPAADNSKVQSMMDALSKVQNWAPEVQHGKRKYSDQKFFESIKKQIESKKDVSERQLSALLKIAARYGDQVPEIAAMIQTAKDSDRKEGREILPVSELTIKKLEIACGLDLPESSKKFADSLRNWTKDGRELTESQQRALNRMILSHAKQIPDFEALKGQLALGEAPPMEPDFISADLIGGLKNVTTWKEPVTRGKMVFSDEAFFKSLSTQFDRKGALSMKQRVALKKMVTRYKDQIPNFEALAEKHEFGKKA